MSRYFAFAKESSYGIPNTTAEMYLNAGKCTLDAPKDPTIEVPSFEETPSDLIKGLYSPSGDVELALDIHSILPILYFTFGQYKFTAGETNEPNIHEIWAAGCHKLPSFTSMVGKGDCGNTDEEFEHQFYGCVISKLSFTRPKPHLTMKTLQQTLPASNLTSIMESNQKTANHLGIYTQMN